MSTWTDARLVAGREVQERLRSKGFWISTLLFLGIIAASIAVPVLLFDSAPEDLDVAVLGAPARVLVEAVDDDRFALAPRDVVDQAEAARLLQSETVDVAVEATSSGVVVTAQQQVPAGLTDVLSSTARSVAVDDALRRRGASAADVDTLLAAVPVQEQLVDDSGVAPDLVMLLSAAFGLLFFFVVYQFGYAIAQGVVLEKESRVVELLVTAVPVRALLYGKVLGNGGLALAQLVLLVLVALGGVALTGERELLALLARNSAWFVLFFVLGFALLSCLWAVTGAFAARTEDLQTTTVPLQMVLILPFFAAVYLPEGTLRTVLSFVPLSAASLMPVRLLQGDARPWEAAVSALLVLAAAIVAVRVGEHLYRASLLRTRGRTSWAQAWAGDEVQAARPPVASGP